MVQCGEHGVGKIRSGDCVHSNVRMFDIAGGWKATTLEAGVWVETATEGGRRSMAAWRK